MRCLKKKPEQRKAAVWVVTVKTVYRRRASRLSLTDCRFTAPTELSLLLFWHAAPKQKKCISL